MNPRPATPARRIRRLKQNRRFTCLASFIFPAHPSERKCSVVETEPRNRARSRQLGLLLVPLFKQRSGGSEESEGLPPHWYLCARLWREPRPVGENDCSVLRVKRRSLDAAHARHSVCRSLFLNAFLSFLPGPWQPGAEKERDKNVRTIIGKQQPASDETRKWRPSVRLPTARLVCKLY